MKFFNKVLLITALCKLKFTIADKDNNVKVKDLPDCKTVYENLTFNASSSGQSPIKYCLNSTGDGMIYGINTDETESSLIDLGTYVFSVNINGIATLVTDSSSNLDEDSLVIYQCSTYEDEQNRNIGKCIRTSGYVFVDSYYYAIPSSDSKEVSQKINTKELSSKCYDSFGNIINYENETIGLCMSNSRSYYYIGFPDSNNNNKNYLLNEENGKIMNGPFYGMNTNKDSNSGIAITYLHAIENKNPTMFYFNRFYSEINYCYDDDNSFELINRREYLCRHYGSSCPFYYCKDGICKRSGNTCPKEAESVCIPNNYDGQKNCDDGYHIVANNNDMYELETSEFSNGSLYYCKDGKCNRKYMYGFFENSNKKSKYPFIRCRNSVNYSYECKLISYPNSSKCNNAGDLINVSTKVEDGSVVESVRLCLSSSSDNTVPLKSENIQYIYTGVEVISYEKYYNIVIILDKNSIHTSDESNYFLIDDKSNKILTYPNSQGRIHECVNLYCGYSYLVGYALNAPYKYDSTVAPFIQCSGNNLCTTIEIANTKCTYKKEFNAAKEGELFKTIEMVDGVESEVFNICLDTTNEQEISLPLKNEYKFENGMSYSEIKAMVSIDSENIFGYKNNKYLMIFIRHDKVYYKKYSYLYRYTFENNMVIDNTILNSNFNRTTECDKETNNIIEFETRFLSNLNLFLKLLHMSSSA